MFEIYTSVVPGIWLLVVLAHTHRNNLGLHYYAPKETPNAFTLLFKKPYPTEGSFNYRNTLGKMATICGVETSEKAEKNIKTVVGISILVQAVFYSFAGAVYSENQTVFLIILVGLGCVLTLVISKYFFIYFILFYFILFYLFKLILFYLFYFILFYFILFYFILFYFISFKYHILWHHYHHVQDKLENGIVLIYYFQCMHCFC